MADIDKTHVETSLLLLYRSVSVKIDSGSTPQFVHPCGGVHLVPEDIGFMVYQSCCCAMLEHSARVSRGIPLSQVQFF